MIVIRLRYVRWLLPCRCSRVIESPTFPSSVSRWRCLLNSFCLLKTDSLPRSKIHFVCRRCHCRRNHREYQREKNERRENRTKENCVASNLTFFAVIRHRCCLIFDKSSTMKMSLDGWIKLVVGHYYFLCDKQEWNSLLALPPTLNINSTAMVTSMVTMVKLESQTLDICQLAELRSNFSIINATGKHTVGTMQSSPNDKNDFSSCLLHQNEPENR